MSLLINSNSPQHLRTQEVRVSPLFPLVKWEMYKRQNNQSRSFIQPVVVSVPATNRHLCQLGCLQPLGCYAGVRMLLLK
jgi:hypothetical protein